MAKNITPRSKNYSQWYLDVIQAAQLADQAPVKGCMVIRPNGYAIWENIQAVLDQRFKESGHQNAYFPLLIPEHFIKKEAEHIQGFSPELAVVTHAGGKALEEALVVRPTSETVVGYMYAQWIKSYRDLPLLINQWCNIIRWEMRTRLFLRTSEFLWQEGHTAHETHQEAETETLTMLNIYRQFFTDFLAMPVVVGKKSAIEKFPGALHTYSVEAMMQDTKALQAGTSHNLGQKFAKAFQIRFLDRHNQLQWAHTTSWGVSTRLIGGLLMTHSDDDGLLLPPRIAPLKVVLIPLGKDQAERSQIMPLAEKLLAELQQHFPPLCIKIDKNFNDRPAERFFHWVQQGVPLRIELGMRDIAQQHAILVRRDNREKITAPFHSLVQQTQETLDAIQTNLFHQAQKLQQQHSYQIDTLEQFQQQISQGGFLYTHWDGTSATEQQIKSSTKATLRCIPLQASDLPSHIDAKPGKCMVSGQPSPQRVLFAQAY